MKDILRGILRFVKEYATLIALIAMGIAMAILQPEVFPMPRNLTNITLQVTIIGIIAIGMTMVILIEGIDLSVGSIIGLSAIIVTLLMKDGLNVMTITVFLLLGVAVVFLILWQKSGNLIALIPAGAMVVILLVIILFRNQIEVLSFSFPLTVWAAIILTLLVSGIVIGLWNGFWIAHYKIPPFIITLGMMTIARGLALTLSNSSSVPVTAPMFPKIGGTYIPRLPSAIIIAIAFILFLFLIFNSVKQSKKYGISVDWLKIGVALGMGVLFTVFAVYAFLFNRYRVNTGYATSGIPVPVAIFAVIALVCIFVLRNTRFGRRLYAIGGNEEAARLSGINIFMTKLIVFCIVAIFATVGGILLASRLNGASPNLGTGAELDVIAAVVIGGTSLSGGSGSITGTIIGAFIIGVLNNGMSQMGITTPVQMIIRGLIIIFAVWFDVISKSKKG